MSIVSVLPAATKLASVLGLASGCALEPAPVPLTTESAVSAPSVVASPPPPAPRAACVPPSGDDRASLVCHRWACDRADLSAATWGGDPGSCAAGDVDVDAQARALRAINTYRFLAGVREVALEPEWNGAAQDCALVAHANGKLSHAPPPSWACWSPRAASASAVSLIANRSAPVAIDAFVADGGNEDTMVHRRWLLNQRVRRLGLGSTSRYGCVVVDGRAFDPPGVKPEPDALAPALYEAWPPAGPVPVDALAETRVDVVGWTVQSSSADLDDARVEVTSSGRALPVETFPLARTLGSLSAIRFVPRGWATEAGARYEVRVVSREASIAFTVEPIACGA